MQAVNLEQVSLGFSAMHVKLTIPSTAFFIRGFKTLCRRDHYHKLYFTSWEIKGGESTVRCLQPPSRQSRSSHTRFPLHHQYLSPLTLLDTPHKNTNARASYLLVCWSCQYCCLATRLQTNLEPSNLITSDTVFLHSTDCSSTPKRFLHSPGVTCL